MHQRRGGASAPPSWTGGNPANSSANLIVNGDFENHAFGNSCQYNLSNGAFTTGMANCTGFGSAAEIDVMSDPGGCFGIPAISGLTKIGIHRQASKGNGADAIAMDLTAGVVAGDTYLVSGWVQSETSFTSDLGVLEIGLGTAWTFGTLVAAVPSNIGWNAFSVIFVAPVGATHLTVTEALNFEGWLHIDGFCLEVIGKDIGTNYCGPANFNSTGQSAAISAFGNTTPSVQLLILTAGQLPPNVFGYFLNSDVQDFKPFQGGSQGNLCLGGGIGRHVKQIGNTGAAGELVIDVDLTALPRPGGTHSVVAGETWNFQCWFRDKNPGATSNFTDGIEIVFQ